MLFYQLNLSILRWYVVGSTLYIIPLNTYRGALSVKSYFMFTFYIACVKCGEKSDVEKLN